MSDNYWLSKKSSELENLAKDIEDIMDEGRHSPEYILFQLCNFLRYVAKHEAADSEPVKYIEDVDFTKGQLNIKIPRK